MPLCSLHTSTRVRGALVLLVLAACGTLSAHASAHAMYVESGRAEENPTSTSRLQMIEEPSDIAHVQPSFPPSPAEVAHDDDNTYLTSEGNLTTIATTTRASPAPTRRSRPAVPTSDLPRLSWAMVGSVFGAWIIGGIFMQWVIRPNLSRAQERIIFWLAMLTVVAVPAAFTVMHGRAGELRGARNPYWKVGLGEATKLLMAMCILPVLRHLSIVKFLFRSSFERTMPFHIVIGVLALAAGTAHGVALVYNRPERAISTRGKNPVLYGTLSWALMVLMVVTGFVRSRFYVTFRLTHWLYIAAFALAIVHVNNFYLMLTPPLCLLAIDYLWRTASTVWFGARVISAEFDPESEITWLKLSNPRASVASAGDYYCLAIPGVGSWFSHPFSVLTSRNGEMLFAVQVAGRWTKSLSQAAPRLVGRRVLLMGPYGALSFPLERTGVLLIVVGGSGFAPAISVLESLVEGDGASARLRYPSLRAVHLLWVSRHPSLLAEGAALIEELLRRCLAAGLHTVTAAMHCTAPRSQSALFSSPLLSIVPTSPDNNSSISKANASNVPHAGTHHEGSVPEIYTLNSSTSACLLAEGCGRYGGINVPSFVQPAHTNRTSFVSSSPLQLSTSNTSVCAWHAGRPNITSFLLRKYASSFASTAPDAESFVPFANVFSCGPESLLDQVKTSVSEANDELGRSSFGAPGDTTGLNDGNVNTTTKTSTCVSMRAHFEIFII